MNRLEKQLMQRDGLTRYEAAEAIEQAKETISCYLDEGNYTGAYNTIMELFGLEPDYLIDIL